MADVDVSRARYVSLSPHLDERARCLLRVRRARTGWAVLPLVSRATGIAASIAEVAAVNIKRADFMANGTMTSYQRHRLPEQLIPDGP